MGFFQEEEESNILDSATSFLTNYGWHLLIGTVVFLILYNRILSRYVEQWRNYRSEQEYAAKYHKNPDLFTARVSGQQEWAEKMQEKYNKALEERNKKQKERAERKNREIAEKYGKPDGFILGGERDSKPNDSFKPAYNPLTGAGSSSSYRPPRRSPCGGGGCGR